MSINATFDTFYYYLPLLKDLENQSRWRHQIQLEGYVQSFVIPLTIDSTVAVPTKYDVGLIRGKIKRGLCTTYCQIIGQRAIK